MIKRRAGAFGLLVLGGAVGMVACQIVEEPPPGTPQNTAASAAPPATASAPATATAAPTAAPAAAPATGPTAAPAAAPAKPTKSLGLRLGASGAGAPAAATPAAAPAATACLDSAAATVPDCSTIAAPSPTCAAFSAVAGKCAAYKNDFNAKVAAAAVACLASSTAAQLCDGARPSACAQQALGQSCADSNVAQLCQIAAGPCKATAAACTSIVSGLNAQGQQQIAQCVATGCGAGLQGCVDALK
jgi:hypothetical protein